MWDNELKETLDTVFAGISNELKETACGIVSTSKCITALKEADIDKVKIELLSKVDQLADTRSTLEKTIADVRVEEELLKREREKLCTDKASFSEERQRFAEELVRMHTINKMQETRVKLNIGGNVFMTSTLTLTMESDSMLAAMFSGRHALKPEDDGSYFLDRDGTHFRYILNYLRDGTFRTGTLPTSDEFLSELYTEAEYYQLNGLMKLLQATMKHSEAERRDMSENVGRTLSLGNAGQTISNGKMPPKRIQRKVMSQGINQKNSEAS
jgi:hypothetical protein